jgi:hypothetical protein
MGGLFKRLAPRPAIPLRPGDFAEQPHIVRKGDDYFLRYRMAIPPGIPPTQRVIFTRKTADKAYYFFGVPTSHREQGQTVERPLASDTFTEYAKKDAVYWLDPDGTETHLRIT